MDNNMETIAAIDIGTTKIVALTGKKTKDNKFEITGFGTTPSKGIRRGVVLNIDETVNSIRIATKKAFESSGIRLNDVFVGIAGQHVLSQKNRCSIRITDEEGIIKKQHIEELENLMREMISDPGEEILGIIPQSYIVDKETGIDNPCDMTGSVLQGNYHIILGQMSMVNNIKKCATISGLKVKSLILEPLASAEAVLTPHEKQSGVALIDIGGGTTDLAVYKNNKVIHTSVIPIGGSTITNDIKQNLCILEKQAEELKIRYGSALQDRSQDDTIISIEGLKGREEKEFSLRQLSTVIQARMEEILHAVMFQIESAGIREKLSGGIVITGGGSLIKNLKQLASFITNNDIRIAYPTTYIEGKFSDILNNPQYSTAIGLIMKGASFNDLEEDKNSFEKLNQTKTEEIVPEEKTNNKNSEPKGKLFDSFKSKMARLFDEDEN
ncbi:MAG TPA: cell division protein FtsA [Bacteroidales bacterium]|nr:cell division protein FtsA [Bacteroidales bacterium]